MGCNPRFTGLKSISTTSRSPESLEKKLIRQYCWDRLFFTLMWISIILPGLFFFFHHLPVFTLYDSHIQILQDLSCLWVLAYAGPSQESSFPAWQPPPLVLKIVQSPPPPIHILPGMKLSLPSSPFFPSLFTFLPLTNSSGVYYIADTMEILKCTWYDTFSKGGNCLAVVHRHGKLICYYVMKWR